MPLYPPFWKPFKKNGGHVKSNTNYLGNYETENRHSGVYIIYQLIMLDHAKQSNVLARRTDSISDITRQTGLWVQNQNTNQK